MRYFTLTAALCAVFLAGPRPVDAVLIDSFNVTQTVTSSSPPPPVTVDDVAIIGGERDVTVGGPGTFADFNSSTPGAFTLARTISSANVVLQYDGNDNSTNLTVGAPGLGPAANFMAGGNAFVLDIASWSGNNTITITAYTTLASYSQYNVLLTGNNVVGTTANVYFTSPGATHIGGGADFTDINALEFTFSTTDPSFAQITLNEISTAFVPEPGSITMLGFGAMALVGYGARRRRKRAGLPEAD